MKKFIVYLLVLIIVVSTGFAIFYLVRDNEIISVTQASMYMDKGRTFQIPLNHKNANNSTEISVSTSSDQVVKVLGNGSFLAVGGGVARINFRTTNVRFRNLWCDVIVGDGTVESPYYIQTASQLASIGTGDYELDNCYKLVNDIDVSGINNGYWLPLGEFSGVLDGNGYTIFGININKEGYVENFLQGANPYSESVTSAFENSGLFSKISHWGKVYNLKIDNFVAVGSYNTLGTIAGVNNGSINRIEVLNATFDLTGNAENYYGGIVGSNISTEETGSGDAYTRHFARIERSHANVEFGKGFQIINNNLTEIVTGITGTVGGIAGGNFAGVIINCYAKGEAHFGNSNIIYGGIVGFNTFKQFVINSEYYDSLIEGAKVKNCYAYITTYMLYDNVDTQIYGGVIGKCNDYYTETEGKYYLIANNLVGCYYEPNLLNKYQNGISDKTFIGVGEYNVNFSNNENYSLTQFENSEYCVMPLSNSAISHQNYKLNFKSYEKTIFNFNTFGEYTGTTYETIYWDIDNVWFESDESSCNFPILNYNHLIVGDEFNELGTAAVYLKNSSITSTSYLVYIKKEYKAEIAFTSSDVLLTMYQKDSAQLYLTPVNVNCTFVSSDTSVATVNSSGVVTAKGLGAATITATAVNGSGIIGGSTAVCTVTVQSPAFSITPASKNLKVGNSFNVLVNSNLKVEWEVEDSNLLSISNATDNSATITAINVEQNGRSQVKVYAKLIYNGVVVTTPSGLEVKEYSLITIESDLVLSDSTITLPAGSSKTVSVVSQQSSNITWSTMNANIATVTNGYITGVGVGTTYITATNIHGDVATVKVIVNAPVLSINYTSKSMEIGNQFNLTVQVENSVVNYNYNNVNWSVNNGGIVSLSQSKGQSVVVTAQGSGSVTISATDNFGTKVYCYVTVSGSTAYDYTITFESESLELTIGQNYALGWNIYSTRPQGSFTPNILWKSSNTNVATVSNNLIEGISEGTSTITAELWVDGVKQSTATCFVTVNNLNIVLSLNKNQITLLKGETFNLIATTNATNYTIEWESANSNVASVINGVVTAKNSGTTNIKAKLKVNGNYVKIATCEVTVNSGSNTNYAYNVSIISPTCNVKMQTNSTRDFIALPITTAPYYTLSWTSSNTSVATVNTNGIVTTKNIHGSTVITVSILDANGVIRHSASRTVSVVIYDNYIDCVEELDAMRYMNYCNYYLTCDLDLTGYNWTPIGTSSMPFTKNFNAKFNGKTYTIIGLTSNGNGETYGGLFGYLGLTADIKNLKLINSSITNYSITGGISGYNGGAIKDCSVINSNIGGTFKVGGIVGLNNGYVKDCNVSGSNIYIVANNNNNGIGGITGWNSGIVFNATVSGQITLKGSYNSSSSVLVNMGGISGYNNGSISFAEVLGGNYIIEAGTKGNLGGIVGSNSGLIFHTKFSGTLTAPTNNENCYVGGIIGYYNGNIDLISVCKVANANITGYYAGGIVGFSNSTQKFFLTYTKYGIGQLVATYINNFSFCAVESSVNVLGVFTGGLAGQIASGVIQNSYTKANVSGVNSKSVVSGMVAVINANLNSLNYGTAGIVRHCYSAATFSGAGTKYAITSSNIHIDGNSRGDAGFCFGYLWNSDLARNTIEPENNWSIFRTNIGKSTTANLKKISTYITQGFNLLYWSLVNGNYASLLGLDF